MEKGKENGKREEKGEGEREVKEEGKGKKGGRKIA